MSAKRKKKPRCERCRFRTCPSSFYGCDYVAITGHSRKGQSAEECTYFRAGPRYKSAAEYLREELEKETKRWERKPVQCKYDWESVRKLYDAGLNDGQIHRVTDIPIATIGSWRHREGLPALSRLGKEFKLGGKKDDSERDH